MLYVSIICMYICIVPLAENVKLQFIQEDIFLFKICYISVCSKTFLKYLL